MSEKDDRGGIRAVLLRMMGLTESQEDQSEEHAEDESVESLQERISALTGQVQDLQDLTKLLAMNQAQLAADMYVIYNQVKDMSGNSSELDVHTDSSPAPLSAPGSNHRKRRGGGSGGMVN